MAASTKPARRKLYSATEIDTGLTALIVCGSSFTASEHLEAIGQAIPASTLREWRTTHAGRLHELEKEQAPKLAEIVAAKAEQIALKAGEAEDRILTRILDTVDDLKPAEASSALRNVSTSKALQVDKISSPLRGRPSSYTALANPRDTIRALAKELGFNADAFDAEAQPIDEAEEAVSVDGSIALPSVSDEANA